MNRAHKNRFVKICICEPYCSYFFVINQLLYYIFYLLIAICFFITHPRKFSTVENFLTSVRFNEAGDLYASL